MRFIRIIARRSWSSDEHHGSELLKVALRHSPIADPPRWWDISLVSFGCVVGFGVYPGLMQQFLWHPLSPWQHASKVQMESLLGWLSDIHFEKTALRGDWWVSSALALDPCCFHHFDPAHNYYRRRITMPILWPLWVLPTKDPRTQRPVAR